MTTNNNTNFPKIRQEHNIVKLQMVVASPRFRVIPTHTPFVSRADVANGATALCMATDDPAVQEGVVALARLLGVEVVS